jgi:hypothetical protein
MYHANFQCFFYMSLCRCIIYSVTQCNLRRNAQSCVPDSVNGVGPFETQTLTPTQRQLSFCHAVKLPSEFIGF